MTRGRCCWGVLAAATVLLLLGTSVQPIVGRAVLINPSSRQHLNPQEYSAAGADGKDPFPGAVCGDGGNQATLPVFGKRYAWARPGENSFVAGQVAEFTVHIENARKGKFEYRICEYMGAETSSTLNNQCLNKHVLQPVPGQVYGGRSSLLPGDVGWWVGESVPYGSAATVTMKYKIPNDLRCDGQTMFCVLQMAYITGNSCNPSHACPTGPPSNCYPVGWNPDCNLQNFQSYRNCADITVRGGGGGGVRTPVTIPPARVTGQSPPALRSPPGMIGDSCCRNRGDGLRKAPRSCTRICLCRGGRTVKRLYCRTGFNFDERTGKCRSASIFRC